MSVVTKQVAQVDLRLDEVSLADLSTLPFESTLRSGPVQLTSKYVLIPMVADVTEKAREVIELLIGE